MLPSRTIAVLAIAIAALSTARADEATDLARDLSNPISSLISVPFQYNFDQNIGPAEDGRRHFINIQPVIPVSIRAIARLVQEWVASIGLDPAKFGTHSLRRTKAVLIYRRTGNLRAVQLLLGHSNAGGSPGISPTMRP